MNINNSVELNLNSLQRYQVAKLIAPTMVAKRVGTNSTISVFFCPLPSPPPFNVDLSRDMGSITWHWGTIRPTQCFIFKIQHCSGGRGLSFSFMG